MAQDKALKKLKKQQKQLVRDTSREDHKKPLSHEEEQYKIDHDQDVTDNEGRTKHEESGE